MFFNSVMLLPYAVIIRLYSIVFPQNVLTVKNDSTFYNFLIGLLPSNTLFYNLLSILLVFFEAVLINRIVIKNRFSRDITLLPGMFFILLSSIYPGMQGISPILLGTFFLILSILNLFKTYKKFNSELYLFNTGLYLGIASVIHYNLILMGIPIVLGYLYIKAFKFRELMQLLSGVLVVFYFYAFYIFWADKDFDFYINIHGLNFEFLQSNYTYLFFLMLFLLLSLLVAIKYRYFTIKKSIQSQNKINILSWVLTASILYVLFVDDKQNYNSLYLISFGLSYFISALFLRIKNNLLLEIVNVVIIFIILIYSFQFYNGF
ncbi:MAG: hypothetical protein R2771_06850 [Saprospiraceae bacterium]